jgi:hypothetical protein
MLGTFGLLWTVAWTYGGVSAAGVLLAALFGRDRIDARRDGLTISRGYGAFRIRKDIPRASILSVYLTDRDNTLRIATPTGTVDVTRLGTDAERSDLASALTAHYGLNASTSARFLPDPWQDTEIAGQPRLSETWAAWRMLTALWLWVLMALLIPASLDLLSKPDGALQSWGAALVIVSVMVGIAALRMTFRRVSWRLEPGRIVEVHRWFGAVDVVRFTAGSLRIIEERDSDGDLMCRLLAVSIDTPPGEPQSARAEKQLHTSSDWMDIRALANWLSDRCGIPVEKPTAR